MPVQRTGATHSGAVLENTTYQCILRFWDRLNILAPLSLTWLEHLVYRNFFILEMVLLAKTKNPAALRIRFPHELIHVREYRFYGEIAQTSR